MEDKKFKISDIMIGDMVFFSIRKTDNLDEYWKVLSKGSDMSIMVTTKGQKMQINLNDVQAHYPALRARPLVFVQ